MKAGAKGVKIQVAGRLGGAEMSRREWDREGRMPLRTLRADIGYGGPRADDLRARSASRSGSTGATSCRSGRPSAADAAAAVPAAQGD